jgi:ribonuclease Y
VIKVNSLTWILLIGIVLLAGFNIFLFIKKRFGLQAIISSNKEAKTILEKSKEDAEKIRREASIEVREKLLNIKSDFERQTRERRRKLNDIERRLMRNEENVEHKFQSIERKEKEFSAKEQRLYAKEKEISEEKRKSEELNKQITEALERISGMTHEEAKNALTKKMEDEAKLEAAQAIRQIEEETREKSQVLASEIISQAIQRSTAEHVVETTVSVVDLPSDDMKGRIIGREGRNIRALEMATNVDIIVDDTPEAVILSSFDPLRRELARLSIDKLVLDGRIHPARIEEVVEKVKA